MENSDKKADNIRHMRWLVKARSQNQKSAMDLYLLIQSHKETFETDKEIENVAQGLISINFSLWRAVFLSEVKMQDGSLFAAAEAFLKNLIEHNVVTYGKDHSLKEWTFNYYMNNAAHRFRAIIQCQPLIIVSDEFRDDTSDLSPSAWWSIYQDALDGSIYRLNRYLTG